MSYTPYLATWCFHFPQILSQSFLARAILLGNEGEVSTASRFFSVRHWRNPIRNGPWLNCDDFESIWDHPFHLACNRSLTRGPFFLGIGSNSCIYSLNYHSGLISLILKHITVSWNIPWCHVLAEGTKKAGLSLLECISSVSLLHIRKHEEVSFSHQR